MKIVYSKETKHEGNECMIYTYKLIVETENNHYIANIVRVYHGWFGTKSAEYTSVFDNYDEAYKYIIEESKEYQE